MRISQLFRHSILITSAAIAAGTAQAKTPAPGPVSAPLAITTRTAVPGHTLKPGSYSINVVDHLPDRCILRVDDTQGHAVATFIGLLNAGYIGPDGLGAVQWGKGPDKTPTLRGFAFANGLTVEFVYPKEVAVALAQLNSSSVPAIDPESEGRPSDSRLSVEDREVVTLWTLTSARVGAGLPAIEAKRYKPQPATELAENTVPPPPQAARASENEAPSQRADKATAPPVAARRAATRSPRTGSELPQTASELPLTFLLSAVFLLAGLGLGVGRRFSAQG